MLIDKQHRFLLTEVRLFQGEQGFYSQTTGAYPSVNAHTLHELSGGDEITFTGYQAYGSARNTYVNGGLSTFAQGYRIGTIMASVSEAILAIDPYGEWVLEGEPTNEQEFNSMYK